MIDADGEVGLWLVWDVGMTDADGVGMTDADGEYGRQRPSSGTPHHRHQRAPSKCPYIERPYIHRAPTNCSMPIHYYLSPLPLPTSYHPSPPLRACLGLWFGPFAHRWAHGLGHPSAHRSDHILGGIVWAIPRPIARTRSLGHRLLGPIPWPQNALDHPLGPSLGHKSSIGGKKAASQP